MFWLCLPALQVAGWEQSWPTIRGEQHFSQPRLLQAFLHTLSVCHYGTQSGNAELWMPVQRRIIWNWRLQNKLLPRCGHLSQGTFTEFFYTSRKNLRLRQGSYAMAVKMGKFSAHGHSAGGQGHSDAGPTLHAALSSRAEGQVLYSSYEDSQAPRHAIASFLCFLSWPVRKVDI